MDYKFWFIVFIFLSNIKCITCISRHYFFRNRLWDIKYDVVLYIVLF